MIQDPQSELDCPRYLFYFGHPGSDQTCSYWAGWNLIAIKSLSEYNQLWLSCCSGSLRRDTFCLLAFSLKDENLSYATLTVMAVTAHHSWRDVRCNVRLTQQKYFRFSQECADEITMYLCEPFLHRALCSLWIERLDETHFLTLLTDHCNHIHVLQKLNRMDAFKDFFQEGLHSKWVLRLCQDLQEFIVG